MTDTSNSKGPAPVQAQAGLLNQSPADPAAAPVERQPIPASEVRPEDFATLTIEYRGGEPVIIARGGTFIPESLPILDDSGNFVARQSLPRPLILANAAFHVGVYGEGQWANARGTQASPTDE
ncbi:hypothetical protein [Streptomyces sp. SPB4]|uniref:hypothetical protein n=1 Tax=Streptomyces sp. SPB4 TaxID=2940553 RepID=UPI002475FD7A|nr:hypothetical protein [Streptomyces sp. SPB4]MDH6545216.1 hypothetical protein [Streptomyces sp. SPB4]